MKHALPHLIAGLLALAVVPPVAAQTNPRRKPVADDEATPKKKARPKTAPEASMEGDDSVEKPQAVRKCTLPAKVKKADMAPEISPSAKAAAEGTKTVPLPPILGWPPIGGGAVVRTFSARSKTSALSKVTRLWTAHESR